MTGYRHSEYAQSFAEFGRPRALPLSNGWLLERPISGTRYVDAMGCYPLFCCDNWTALPEDLSAVGSMLVSVCLVTDPFGRYDETLLRNCFPDLMVPFKEHFVVNRSLPAESFVTKHHKYYARKALQAVTVERCPSPTDFLEDWVALYANLIERHKVTGIKAFSRDAFAKQLRIPGMVALRAVHENATVGAHLWYVQDDIAYSHLAAFNTKGYELMAAYALYWTALHEFEPSIRWLDIGAGAGAQDKAGQGLTFFKRGWSTGTRIAYLCGRVFNQTAYDELAGARCPSRTNYFPAYRQHELT